VSAREELASEALRLQAGGTLNPRRHVYIERPEDAEALRLLIAGEYVNILSSRQMGKSSLMVRIVRELRARGVRIATVDLAAEMGSPADADTFYLSLLRCITRELDVEVALNDWWEKRSSDSVNRRFIDFFHTVILAQILGPVVVCLDEIDSTLRLSYTDDLFTAIRGMYNQRATSAVFDRLTFCLLGVASPNELIKDRRTTPYNIGTTIELRDFDASRDDLRSLAERVNPDPDTGSGILGRVLYWTDGHPYLTVKLCAELIGAKTTEAVDHYVDAAFTNLDRLSGDAHFQSILRFVQTRLADGLTALTLYTRVLGGRHEHDRQTVAHAELKLSGLVKRDDTGNLVIRNRIYRRLFDVKWAAGLMPVQAGRWYRTYAIAASILLLAVIGAGAGYYLLKFRPALEARNELLALGVQLPEPQTAAELPNGLSQANFQSAVTSLAKVGGVTELSSQKATVRNLSPLTVMTGLQSLSLTWTDLADIAPLARLTALRSLSLSATSVGDIAPLADLSALQSLNLSLTKVSDIAPLARLTALQSLDLSRTQVTALAPLSGLIDLKSLCLAWTEVADIAPLAGLTALQSLCLSGTDVNDIAPLAGLKNLQSLDLSWTRVTNISPLARLKNLQSLDLSWTRVTNISPLAGLTALQSLDLSHTQVADIAPLVSLCSKDNSNLQTDLTATRVPDSRATKLRCKNGSLEVASP
jgi:Leucine-rich repeat (LRR) protein